MSRLRSVTSVTTVVLATLVIALVAYAGASRIGRPVVLTLAETTPSPSKPAAVFPSPPPAPPPGPARYVMYDIHTVDVRTGWALLTDCGLTDSADCRYLVTGTADGGQTWTTPVQAGPRFPSTDGDAPRNIRFVDQMDGFVYGHSVAYVTHDGGQTWHSLDAPGVFYYGIEAQAGTVWMVTSPCGKGQTCPLEARSSHDAGRTWSAPHALPGGFAPEILVPFARGVVMTNVPTGDLEMTADGGASWSSIKSPCGNNPFRANVATADGTELFELCTGYPRTDTNSADKTLFVSQDAGRTWSQRSSSKAGGGLFQTGWPGWIISNRLHRAFTAGDHGSLITHDAGATWAPLAVPDTALTLLRFAGADEGWAVGDGKIWSTIDGGDDWTLSGAMPPGVR